MSVSHWIPVREASLSLRIQGSRAAMALETTRVPSGFTLLNQ
jgi:hypothetical protein